MGPYAGFIRQYYFMSRTGAILAHERGTKDCYPHAPGAVDIPDSWTFYRGPNVPVTEDSTVQVHVFLVRGNISFSRAEDNMRPMQLA